MRQTMEFRGRMTRLVLAAAVLLGITSAASAQPAAPAPEVSVTRVAGGRVLVEVADAGVSVRKEIAAGTSHAVITTPVDELQVRVARGQMVVSTPGGSVTIAGGRAAEMGQLMTLLQRSDAAVRGLALLKRVPTTTRDFGQQALLLTRAVLELGAGPSEAIAIHRRGMAEERERLVTDRPGARGIVTRVSVSGDVQMRGPGDCWDLYAEEALRIADDFVDCTDDLKWYDFLDWAGCSLLYTVRAEGAMAWFIACNGGVPFRA